MKERQMPPAARQQSPVDKQKGCETSVDGVRRHLCVHLRQGDFWHRTWEESLAGRQVSIVLQRGKGVFWHHPWEWPHRRTCQHGAPGRGEGVAQGIQNAEGGLLCRLVSFGKQGS